MRDLTIGLTELTTQDDNGQRSVQSKFSITAGYVYGEVTLRLGHDEDVADAEAVRALQAKMHRVLGSLVEATKDWAQP